MHVVVCFGQFVGWIGQIVASLGPLGGMSPAVQPATTATNASRDIAPIVPPSEAGVGFDLEQRVELAGRHHVAG